MAKGDQERLSIIAGTGAYIRSDLEIVRIVCYDILLLHKTVANLAKESKLMLFSAPSSSNNNGFSTAKIIRRALTQYRPATIKKKMSSWVGGALFYGCDIRA